MLVSQVRAYMHGYFVDAKLYRQLHALAKPFAYDEWRKQKAREKQAAKAASRISAASARFRRSTQCRRSNRKSYVGAQWVEDLVGRVDAALFVTVFVELFVGV